ncbi:Ubiquitin fusion degradation protein 4 [Madurella mycetomatis]|uniref:HECT-type E3 ubiquitin transferase n=1 Tax=Madurella mycetomatis TaxID=100816 RepID=A0A150ATJ7_9PEZI|nr:Ubiquitin fusion degradation protein 4 [Madurella mycetomatis]
MPSRVTRSSARQAAGQAAPSTSNPTAASPTSAAAAPSIAAHSPSLPPSTRKRKSKIETSPAQGDTESPSSARRSKRQRVAAQAAPQPQPPPVPVPAPSAAARRRKGKAPATMSSPGTPGGPANLAENPPSASSSRRSSRNKKNAQSAHDDLLVSAPSSSRRSKRAANDDAQDQDVVMSGTEEHEKASAAPPPPPPPPEDRFPDDSDENDDDDEPLQRYDEDDDVDPFSGFGGPGGRLKDILNHLRQKDDPTMQLIALQELSEILLVSNEDNLSGHFSPDAFVKELVLLMQPNELTGEENPEIMLLACRCLANLMEALPASTANVVYGNAVPILCQKLLEISFIDLAEQALSTLEKISLEYPASIVREGGLNACLSYLEFFATSTQRVAVTTAANCCRNLDPENFPVVRDVMPTLLNVLGSNDQRVVEHASLCVTRIVESFRFHARKLEELVSVDLLKAILRLLLPGTTNLIGPHIHTQFLRVLAFTARASPRLSAELFKLNVVETLYQILTGVSPPSGTDDLASKLDSVLIMQALIHRPREQIIETLNVICELLPNLPNPVEPNADHPVEAVSPTEPITPSSQGSRRRTTNEKRVELLEGCKDEVRRFSMILFPTLTDAYSSTVNLNVRQKVLLAQLKMLSNLDAKILVEALKPVSYASFLASILSQQDHPSLVMFALQATELLMSRLGEVYRYQLYREGVIAEITKLATQEPETVAKSPVDRPAGPAGELETEAEQESDNRSSAEPAESHSDHDDSDAEDEGDEENDDGDDDDDDDDRSRHTSDEDDDDDHENDNDDDHNRDDISGSPASSEGSTMSIVGPPGRLPSDLPSMKTRIAAVARRFLEAHETEKEGKVMKKKATEILNNLSILATDIENFYLHRTSLNLGLESGTELFTKLASYFDSDVLESVTSAELLASGVVRVLEQVFSNPDEQLAVAAQSAFLQVFMGYTVKSKPKTATADSPATPLSVLIHKLQDLLSRSEHFEVLTVHHHAFDGNRNSAASMLAKQIRLKLVADDDSGIPRHYRNIMVSIHAITTFKSLDDYLRPRISLSERPRGPRGSRDAVSRALAAMASSGLPMSAAAARLMEQAALPPSGHSSSGPPPPPPPPGASSQASPQPSSSRSARRSKSRSQPGGESPATPEPSSREKAVLRRSSRRQAAPGGPARPPPEEDDDLENALECADERQLSDDEDMGDDSALDVVRDLDEGMRDDQTPDPSAVNLELAAGGKITARKEDGTRVPTPSQSRSSTSLPSRSSALTAALQGTPTPAASSRPMSYAAAIQAVPQDWHIEFSINGKVIPNETTIYRAVHNSATTADDHLSRNVWSAVHPINFRRVPGPPPPAESTAFGSMADGGVEAEDGGTPGSLSKFPITASILRLLKKLHDLNANIDDVLVENKEVLKVNVEPLPQFVNTKLTAKLNRQLEEPLIVASNCLPSWSEDLARLYPFLFPFETRHLFLQSTSFGYARSMSRWQNAQSQEEARRDRRDERPFLGRLQRQKVRIARAKILESAVKVMELYGASQSILEVEYFDEVGTGLGPTLEFYSTVSKEFCKKKLRLWRDNDPNGDGEFVSGPNGLFPRPLSEEFAASEEGEKILQLFKMLGKFVARSMIDSRIIDLNFNPIFFRIGNESAAVRPSLGAVKSVDPVVARSLMTIKKFALAKKAIDEDPNRNAAQKVLDTANIVIDKIQIDDLYLDFTLPGYPEIELVPNGSHTRLTIDNVDLYLEKVIDMTLGTGVRRQVDAFRAGFSQVFPYSALSAFTPDELCTLFGRVDEDWSLETLMDSVKADHGYNMDSKSVRNLLQTMSELTPSQRRDFLQFTTGSPKLPIGGFKSLTPMFTVVCKPSEAPYTSDDYLPSVMTCVNYLKLPDYSSVEILKQRLFTAIKEGQGAFHLS